MVDLATGSAGDLVAAPVEVLGPNPSGTIYVSSGNKIVTGEFGVGYHTVATLPHGATSLAIDPTGRFLYAADATLAVDVVDVTASPGGAFVAAIPVGFAPMSVAIHPSGNPLYVATVTSGVVSVVDTATRTVIATIPTTPPTQGGNGGPNFVVVHPTGTFVYATTTCTTVECDTDGYVSVIDRDERRRDDHPDRPPPICHGHQSRRRKAVRRDRLPGWRRAVSDGADRRRRYDHQPGGGHRPGRGGARPRDGAADGGPLVGTCAAGACVAAPTCQFPDVRGSWQLQVDLGNVGLLTKFLAITDEDFTTGTFHAGLGFSCGADTAYSTMYPISTCDLTPMTVSGSLTGPNGRTFAVPAYQNVNRSTSVYFTSNDVVATPFDFYGLYPYECLPLARTRAALATTGTIAGTGSSAARVDGATEYQLTL